MSIGTRIKMGESAPLFVTNDVMGRRFSLDEYVGKRSLALIFLRFYGCPLCQIALQQFKIAYPEFEKKDAEVAVVLQSPATTILESGDVSVFPFRLIPDPHGLLYKQYGVGSGNLFMAPRSVWLAFTYLLKGYKTGKTEGNAWQLPGNFLIDKDGLIRFMYVGKYMGDNLHPDRLLPLL